MTATDLPVLLVGWLRHHQAHLVGLVGQGLLHRLDRHRHMSSRLSVQASSQGAGQMRPVNSGKLLVECRLRIASSQLSLKTRSFQSGIWLWIGQPVGPWQKGIPQSMQRAACLATSESDIGMVNSLKCRTRSEAG